MICSKCGKETGSNETLCENCKKILMYGDGDIFSQKKPATAEAMDIDAALKQLPKAEDEYFEEDEALAKKRRRTKIIVISAVATAVLVIVVAIIMVVLFSDKQPEPEPTPVPVVDPNINTVGNTPENIANGGIATVQGDYIYFALREFDDAQEGNAQTADSGIYKMKSDGSGRTLLCEAYASSINVVGDYVYFTDSLKKNFYRMRLDGGGVTTLISGALEYVTVTTDYIFYLDTETSVLHRASIDGSGDKEFASPVSSYCIDGKTLYYKESVDDAVCYKTGLNAKNPSPINGNYIGRLSCDNNIFYTLDNAGNIYKTSQSDGVQKLIYQGAPTSDYICAADGTVYFSAAYNADIPSAFTPQTTATTEPFTSADGEAQTTQASPKTPEQAVYKISDDGSGLTMLCEVGAKQINIVGNRLFCVGQNNLTFVLNTDGSGYEVLSKQIDRTTESYLRSELAKHTGDSIISFVYMDYNNDGINEAFAFTGSQSQSGVFGGELWYLSSDKTEKVLTNASYSEVGTIYTFGSEKFYKLETYSSSQITASYIYGVNDKGYYLHPLSGAMGFTLGEEDVITVYDAQLDASVSSGGYTKKPYWLYFDKNSNKFVEYGAIAINEVQLYDIEGAEALVKQNVPDDNSIVSILYRNNGIININYTDGEWQNYITLQKAEEGITLVETGDGYYKPALYSQYASYPDPLPETEATTDNSYTSTVATTTRRSIFNR